MIESIKRLFDMAGEYKQKMLLSVFLAMTNVIFGILPFFMIYKIIVEVMEGNAGFNSTGTLAVIAGCCLVLKVLAFSASTSLSHRVAYRILYNMRIALANKIADLPLGFLTARQSGTIKKVMLDDVEKLEQFLAHNIPETISSIIIPIFVALYMFFLDWRMALALLSTIPLSYAAFVFMMKDYDIKITEFSRATEHMNNTIVEYVKGMAVIKAFNQTTKSFEKYNNALDRYQKHVFDWFKACWPYMGIYFVIITANIIVVLPVGAWFYTSGSLELSKYILFMLIALGFSAPLIKLTEFFDGLALISNSEQRVNEILQEKELYKSQKNLKPDDYDIRVSNIRFSYDRTEVIKKISFHAKQGTTTALVGPSGSGKSTIAKLIARFWDVNSGQITIGGVDIKEIALENLMEIVSFVFQDVFLFNDSIKENIRIGRRNATDAEVIKAAKQAMCHDFIMKTEKGYETDVGDDGCKLSGGERQRLSIARSILRNAPIIVLDEATAFTDPENEDRIQESLNRLTKDKTVIVIAHRLSTIIFSEQIIVLNEGEIQNVGTHNELLKDSILYKSMWQAHINAMDWQFECKGDESQCIA